MQQILQPLPLLQMMLHFVANDAMVTSAAFVAAAGDHGHVHAAGSPALCEHVDSALLLQLPAFASVFVVARLSIVHISCNLCWLHYFSLIPFCANISVVLRSGC